MFGEITNSKVLGGWDFKNHCKVDGKLRQDLATAFNKLYGEKFGGSYAPVYYCGEQLVNGTNHMLIVERTKIVSGGKEEKDFAKIVINIPAGDTKGEKAIKVSEEDANDFVLRDEIEKGFKQAISEWTGMRFRPLLEVGTQVVKGINYHFICEGTISYKTEVNVSLVYLIINDFAGEWKIVGVERI